MYRTYYVICWYCMAKIIVLLKDISSKLFLQNSYWVVSNSGCYYLKFIELFAQSRLLVQATAYYGKY